jgi:hypothetical protein
MLRVGIQHAVSDELLPEEQEFFEKDQYEQ